MGCATSNCKSPCQSKGKKELASKPGQWLNLVDSYNMGCPPVHEDNPQALASGLSNVEADNPWYNYFIP